MIERKSSNPISREPSYDELEEALLIDKEDLDSVNETHADLFHRVSKQLALLISRRDAAKLEKEDIEARIDARIRHDAEVHETKLTEKQVESEKRLHKDVQAAVNRQSQLNEQVGRWSALKESFQQRSYALGHLADLYVSGYFGGTSGASARMKEHDAGNARREMHKLRTEKR